ncbi:hypothetical protein PIB30_021682 [Stylosanthes scabra]|uniref:Uncharacterized protein n=1 Tax=Stylosanthes scabra TaxID=79078 RepID=A0ABU6Z5Q2_9FABA|nr:hypothetical protein [Stylosanthes scabra]
MCRQSSPKVTSSLFSSALFQIQYQQLLASISSIFRHHGTTRSFSSRRLVHITSPLRYNLLSPPTPSYSSHVMSPTHQISLKNASKRHRACLPYPLYSSSSSSIPDCTEAIGFPIKLTAQILLLLIQIRIPRPTRNHDLVCLFVDSGLTSADTSALTLLLPPFIYRHVSTTC